jgi:hypothetical protein
MSPAALAQGQKASVSDSQSVTARVTIKSIDEATRHVVVVDAAGETFTIKAPAEVRNFDQLKVGQSIRATYTVETEFVLSAPNTPLPPDTDRTVETRAARGALPAGAVKNHIVVTGAVVGVDLVNHTLQLVDPKGGRVHTVAVRPDRYEVMREIKVGDTITAYVTESLMLAVHPE